MPVLKNARHESFAQALVTGKTADEAYESAGYKPHRGNASTLRSNQIISDRVAELQQKAAEKVGVTIKSLTDELEEARAIAITEKQSSAAVAATMGKAKLHGLIIEKKQHSGPNGGPIQSHTLILDPEKLKAMTSDELAALEAAIGKLHGSAGNGESRTDAEGDAEAYSGAIDGGEG
jgi:hypothetical protein